METAPRDGTWIDGMRDEKEIGSVSFHCGQWIGWARYPITPPTHWRPLTNPAASVGEEKSGAQLIAEERQRQISQEGWTTEHDDRHRSGELNDAAIGYAQAAALQARGESIEIVKSAVPAGYIRWPWEDSWWKPSEDQIRNLVKAGALIAAEIDRLQRATKK